MARTLALSTLVTRCRQRANRENDQTITTAEWKSLISETYGELYETVAGTGMRYFETEGAITANGSASYTEPTDMLASLGVDRVLDSLGRRAPLFELMQQETSLYEGQVGDAVAYAMIDDQLFLYPKPSSGTYKWRYIAQPTDLSTAVDTTLVDVVTADGEGFLIWGVVVKAGAKLEQNVQLAMAEREAARARLLDWAALRVVNRARRPIVTSEGVDCWDDTYYDPANWRFRRS